MGESTVIIVFAGGATDSGASTEQTRTRENEICKITVTFILLPDNAAEDVPNTQQSTGAPPSGILHEAATDAEQIKSVRDRLGISIDYLEGVMKLGEFISEVSSDWTEILIDTLSFGFRSSILQ